MWNADLLDSEGGKIRGTAFVEDIPGPILDLLKSGKEVYITNGFVKPPYYP